MYRELKEKSKDLYRYSTAEDLLLEMLAEMFSYSCDDFHMEYAELYLNAFGECAFWMLDGELIVTRCQRGGTPDVHGYGTVLICTTLNGVVKEFDNFMTRDDVVYVKNNKFATHEGLLEQTADLFAEIDKSIKYNIRNSRLKPIVRGTDRKTVKALELALSEDRDDKDYITIVSGNILEGEAGLDVYHVTDVKDQDKIGYLTRAREDLFRIFLNTYGIDTCGSTKMAQQTETELNAGCNSRLIIPLQKLEERKKGIDEINKKFGKSWSVAFAEPWVREFTEPEPEAEEGGSDNGSEDSEGTD